MPNNFGYLIIALCLSSCGFYNTDNDSILAKIGDEALTKDDVRLVLGDSISFDEVNVKLFVNNWLRDQVALQNAQKLLSPSEKDFKEELLAYENSLIRYAYESKYINERIDTLVSEKDILSYYKGNFSNFELKENIVKVRVIKLNKKSKELVKLKKNLCTNDSISLVKLKKQVKNQKLFFLNYDTSWVSLEEIKTIVPLKIYNEENFISNNDYVEISDGGFLWMIYFVDYTLKDNISPIEAVKGKIKSILINQRKLTLVKQMEKQLYEKAIEKGEIKLYLN